MNTPGNKTQSRQRGIEPGPPVAPAKRIEGYHAQRQSAAALPASMRARARVSARIVRFQESSAFHSLTPRVAAIQRDLWRHEARREPRQPFPRLRSRLHMETVLSARAESVISAPHI